LQQPSGQNRPVAEAKILSGPPKFPFRLFLTGLLGFSLIAAVPALYDVAFPYKGRSFGLAEGQASLLLGAHRLGALAAVTAGMFGLRRLSLRLSLVLLASGAAGLTTQASFLLMLAAAMVLGAEFGLLCAATGDAAGAGAGDRTNAGAASGLTTARNPGLRAYLPDPGAKGQTPTPGTATHLVPLRNDGSLRSKHNSCPQH